MPVQLIAIAAGIVISWLLFTALIRVLKIGITTALTVAVILLLIQILFGINYEQILQEMEQLLQKFLVN